MAMSLYSVYLVSFQGLCVGHLVFTLEHNLTAISEVKLVTK